MEIWVIQITRMPTVIEMTNTIPEGVFEENKEARSCGMCNLGIFQLNTSKGNIRASNSQTKHSASLPLILLMQ